MVELKPFAVLPTQTVCLCFFSCRCLLKSKRWGMETFFASGLINFMTDHSLRQWFPNLNVQKATWRAWWNSFLGPIPKDSDSVDLGGAMDVHFCQILSWCQCYSSENHIVRTSGPERTRRWGWLHPPAWLWFQCTLDVFYLPNTPIGYFHSCGSSVPEGLCQL